MNEPLRLTPRDVVELLKNHPRRWVAPMIACTVLAGVFGLLRTRSWEASQALIIREEVSAHQDRLGSFVDLIEMKTTQETILELARSKNVLRAALEQVGPPADRDDAAAYPTNEEIADLRDAMKLTPPGGAEFGKTEVFYLKVKQRSRPRAILLAGALCDQLQASFQTLRQAKYESVIHELQRSETMAEADLHKATSTLGDLERAAGVDLAELRMLLSASSSTSDLRQKLIEVQSEVRRYQAQKQANQQLLAVLRAAQDDPGRLLASPSSLLDAQPALKQLKDGLINAQLKRAAMEGAMSAKHPLVQVAKAAEIEIGMQLHDELAIAIDGVQIDLQMDAERVAALKAQLANDQTRLERLAAMRADYSNRIAMSQNRTELLEGARANLAEARAQQAAATNVSLISRIGRPDTGTKPVGPGTLMILVAGMFGGLTIGLGIVFLTVEPALAPQPLRKEKLAALRIGDDGGMRKFDQEPAWS